MANMSIKKDLFIEFLNKTNSLVDEVVFNFEEDGLNVSMRNRENTGMIYNFLDKSLFENYNPVGIVCFNQIGTKIQIIKNFKEKVEFIFHEFEGKKTLMTLKEGNKEIEMSLVDIETIYTKINEPDFKIPNFKDFLDKPASQLAEKFIIDAKELTESMKSFFLGDSKKTSSIDFQTIPNKLTISYDTDNYKFKDEFLINNIVGGNKGRYTSHIYDIINEMKGNLEIRFATNNIFIVTEKTEKSVFLFVYAPIVEKE